MEKREFAGCDKEGEDRQGCQSEEVYEMLFCYGGDGADGGGKRVDVYFPEDLFLWESLGSAAGLRGESSR